MIQLLTAHKPHGCFFVTSRFSFRKKIILAERTQLVSPPRRSMRETLAIMHWPIQKTNATQLTLILCCYESKIYSNEPS